ncbi:MAG: FAD-binding oxidoreductase, partial [Chloroflexi bacterium]|nr:FAD-binding oxidoreductase [Chloroflexota bacterium]
MWLDIAVSRCRDSDFPLPIGRRGQAESFATPSSIHYHNSVDYRIFSTAIRGIELATIDSLKLDIIRELQGIVGDDYVVYKPEDLIVYEYDGSADKAMPAIVVIPDTAEQVSEIMKLARANEVPIVARGAGTGVSGGAVAQVGGIVLSLTRMTRILE